MIPSTFLDRLLQRDPAEGILRDLEHLLNQDAPAALGGAGRVDAPPDGGPDDATRAVCEAVRRRLRSFDPRLSDVRVEPVRVEQAVIHLRIAARVRGGDTAQPLALDARTSGDRWSCHWSDRHDR